MSPIDVDFRKDVFHFWFDGVSENPLKIAPERYCPKVADDASPLRYRIPPVKIEFDGSIMEMASSLVLALYAKPPMVISR